MPIDPSISASSLPPASAAGYAYSPSRADQERPVDSKFGPDYILDDSLKPPPPPPPAGTVPFMPPPQPNSAGQTLASLPPLEPVGAASLTELSLQNQMLAPVHEPFKPKDADEG
jgi:hypothetical protein